MEVASVVLQVCTAVKFPRSSFGTGSREIDIACLLDGWTGIFAFLLPHAHARTRTHRVVSNDLTSVVEEGGRGGGNCCSNEPETGNGFTRGVVAYEKREERKVKRLPARRGEATPEVISCRLFTSRPSILLCKYYYWPSRTPFQWKIDARNLVLRWKEKKKKINK